PALQGVGALDHLVEGLERQNRRHWPEWLLGHDLRIVRHIGDHGRLKKEALIAVTRAAGDDFATAVLGVIDEAFHRIEPTWVGERPERDAFLETIAHFETLRILSEARHELAVVLFVHVEARRRDADLTR